MRGTYNRSNGTGQHPRGQLGTPRKRRGGSPMEDTVDVKVLLVDGQPAHLQTLSAVLEALSGEMVEARSGAEALEVLKRTEIALVLLDIQMPGMDGFETAKHIKQDFPDRYVPIIFVTGIYNDDPYVLKGYEAGGVDFFGK